MVHSESTAGVAACFLNLGAGHSTGIDVQEGLIRIQTLPSQFKKRCIKTTSTVIELDALVRIPDYFMDLEALNAN